MSRSDPIPNSCDQGLQQATIKVPVQKKRKFSVIPRDVLSVFRKKEYVESVFPELTIGAIYRIKTDVTATTRDHDLLLPGVSASFDLPMGDIVCVRQVGLKEVLVQSRLTQGNCVVIPRQFLSSERTIGNTESFSSAIRDRTDCIFGCRCGATAVMDQTLEATKQKKMTLVDLKKFADETCCGGCDDMQKNGNIFTDFCHLGINCTKFSYCREILMQANSGNSEEVLQQMIEFKTNAALLISLRRCTADLEYYRHVLHEMKVTDRAYEIQQNYEEAECTAVLEQMKLIIERQDICPFTSGVSNLLSHVRDPLLISYDSLSSRLNMTTVVPHTWTVPGAAAGAPYSPADIYLGTRFNTLQPEESVSSLIPPDDFYVTTIPDLIKPRARD